MDTNLIYFLIAVTTASLVGSVHCAGMCGAFVCMACGTTDRSSHSWISLCCYHTGRLTSYCLLGAIAGMLGAGLDYGSNWVGYQKVATFFAGILMIVLGVFALLELRGWVSWSHQLPDQLQDFVKMAYRKANQQSPWLRGLTIGMMSTLLPCGWLYAFAITAAGTAHPVTGIAVMFAFWLGTVPILTLFGWGSNWMSLRLRQAMPYLIACMMIFVGLDLCAMRSQAHYELLHDSESPVISTELPSIPSAESTPPPCCQQRTP